MSTDPTRPSFTPVQRLLLTALSGLIVAALAGAAYALTYDVLRDLALLGGVSSRWAPLYPAIADTLTTLTILALVITRNARWWTRSLRWALLLVLVAGGATISVQDSISGMSTLPHDVVRVGVAVAPHVMLLIAIWLWLTMFKQIRVARPTATEPETVEAQRGHVKVLGPATPEPLALEAPTASEPEPLIPFPDERDFPDEFGEPPALSAEPTAPPLNLPPAPPPLLPTDVELVRTRDRDEPRPVSSTTRPDIALPTHSDPDENPTPDLDTDDENPPSSNLRSGPTPPTP